MTARFGRLDLLIPSTAVGFVATFAAPWLELQGTFQSWRIVEWHTFWRGDGAFTLGDVVANNYRIPVEYATNGMQTFVHDVFWIGSALGVWHLLAWLALLLVGARWRLTSGASRRRVLVEMVGLVVVNAAVLYGLTALLTAFSQLSLKVDFRTPADLHSDSLIWSNITLLPVAPVLSVLAAGVQVVVIALNRLDMRRI